MPENKSCATLEVGARIRMTGVEEEIEAMVRQWLTFPNPRYVEGVKSGRWVKNIPSTLSFYQPVEQGLDIPRGCLYRLIREIRSSGQDVRIIDNRTLLPMMTIPFSGELRDFQVPAVNRILESTQGFLKATTGSGKTVMAMNLISRRRQPALVIVPNKALMYQWADSIERFLSIPPGEIGLLGDGHAQVGDSVTVGIINSVSKQMPDLIGRFGHVIVDEAHKVVSATYQEVLSQVDATYLLALSATPYRRDGMTGLLFITLGDIVAEIQSRDLVDAGQIVNAEVQWVRTDFQTETSASDNYTRVIDELIHDHARNDLICRVAAAHEPGKPSLILSDRKEHCYLLQSRLATNHAIASEVMVGGLPRSQVKASFDSIASGRSCFLIGTTQLLGEGFDLPALEVLYLTVPLRFRGRLVQNIGRILRSSKGKQTAMIYDFVDHRVGVLKASAVSRVRSYESAGIKNLKAK